MGNTAVISGFIRKISFQSLSPSRKSPRAGSSHSQDARENYVVVVAGHLVTHSCFAILCSGPSDLGISFGTEKLLTPSSERQPPSGTLPGRAARVGLQGFTSDKNHSGRASASHCRGQENLRRAWIFFPGACFLSSLADLVDGTQGAGGPNVSCKH